ncbi:MAG: sigma-70 family RNA polymerase sigma factor [Anaerolineae bacterium]|nr:sigma-70 family RNA polymerase sigma factor [Anaerolineae bacterium]
MQQLSDETLLSQVVNQDAAALEELYDRHGQVVYNLIVRIVKQPAIADELLQETFWQVWQQAAKFKGTGSVAAWIYRIARNKSLDQLRRQSARPQPAKTDTPQDEQIMWAQLAADNAEVEPIAERHQDQASVRQALLQIPEEQRLCLELAYFEGLSQRQIAQQTDTPLGTIKTRIRMGMDKLERILTAAGYQSRDF